MNGVPLDGSSAALPAEGLSLPITLLTLLTLCLCLSGCSSFLSSGNDDALSGLDISFLFGLPDARGWLLHAAVAAVLSPVNKRAKTLINLLIISLSTGFNK